MPHEGRMEPTLLLERWVAGDLEALHALIPDVYADLRRIARRELRAGQGSATLQPTALVNEVWVHLLGRPALGSFESRAHFFNLAAKVMRQLLLMRARARGAHKRGGQWQRVDAEALLQVPALEDPRHEEMDQALSRLEALEPRVARVVELRYYLGMTVPEVASALAVDTRTVYRDWATARAWLANELAG